MKNKTDRQAMQHIRYVYTTQHNTVNSKK